MRLPSSSIVRILKSIPIVVMKEGVHASSQKRSKRQDLPTAEHWGRKKRNVNGIDINKLITRVANKQELRMIWWARVSFEQPDIDLPWSKSHSVGVAFQNNVDWWGEERRIVAVSRLSTHSLPFTPMVIQQPQQFPTMSYPCKISYCTGLFDRGNFNSMEILSVSSKPLSTSSHLSSLYYQVYPLM